MDGAMWTTRASTVACPIVTAEIRALSGFYPAHVADVKIWLDASRIGVTGENSGDDLEDWKDLSGNGFDATKGTGGGGAKPNWFTGVINGLPAVHYASGEDHDLAKGPYNRNLNITPHTELMVFQSKRRLGNGKLLLKVTTFSYLRLQYRASAANRYRWFNTQ
jgi:hypothetical protein